MTEKEYEGTPELIFYCEYNPNNFEDRLEIPFTNEYMVKIYKGKYLSFSDDKVYFVECIPLREKSTNLFGKNILNVSVLAGCNGIGKTNILKGIVDKQHQKDYVVLKIFRINEKNFLIESSLDYSKKYQVRFFLKENSRDEKYYKCKYIFNDIASNFIFEIAKIKKQSNSLLLSYGFPRMERTGPDNHEFKRLIAKDTLLSLYDLMRLTNFSHAFFDGVESNITLFFSKDESFLKGKLFFSDVECFQLSDRFIDSFEDITSPSFLHLFIFDIFYKAFLVYKNQHSLSYERPRAIVFIESIEDMHKAIQCSLGYLNQYSINLCNIHDSFLNATSGQGVDSIRNLIRLILESTTVSRVSGKYIEIEIKESVSVDDVRSLVGFVDRYNRIFDGALVAQIGKFSSGEYSILSQIGALFSAISREVTNPGMVAEDHNFSSVIILIDEYEQHLHPEWSRKYLSYLLKFLNVEGERLGIKFQVILTTHSPYLISDLPKENIILIKKDKMGKRRADKSNYGFASNYYDIMSDSFFLDDTIGEFAKQKINNCIQTINRISDDLDKLANDELILHDGLSLFIEESLEAIEEQNKIIDLVGDKFIQKQLQQLSNSVKQRLLANSDNSVRKQQIEQDIAELEEKLRQKKMELNND